MYFRRLRYFESVARCGSFSRASGELHVAQPALSSQIAELEADFGLQLFTRHSRGVALTEAGHALMPRAEQLLGLIEDVRAEMMAFRATPHGEVRLGLPTTITSVLTLPLLAAAAELLPGVNFQVVEGMTGHLEKWLDHGEIDVAILFRPPSARPHATPVGEERLALIGREDDDLAGLVEVPFSEVARRPLIHTTRTHHLRQLIDEHSLSLRLPLNVTAEIDSLPQIKLMVAQSRGYTVLPTRTVGKDWQETGVRAWPIADPPMNIQLFLVSACHGSLKPHCRAAMKLVEDTVRDLIEGGTWLGASAAGVAARSSLLPIALTN